MKEDILLGSFWIPSGEHIPLLTSTPFGFREEKASQTFSAWSPPANIHPFLLLTSHLEPLPVESLPTVNWKGSCLSYIFGKSEICTFTRIWCTGTTPRNRVRHCNSTVKNWCNMTWALKLLSSQITSTSMITDWNLLFLFVNCNPTICS
jgi:hypothetical protein